LGPVLHQVGPTIKLFDAAAAGSRGREAGGQKARWRVEMKMMNVMGSSSDEVMRGLN